MHGDWVFGILVWSVIESTPATTNSTSVKWRRRSAWDRDSSYNRSFLFIPDSWVYIYIAVHVMHACSIESLGEFIEMWQSASSIQLYVYKHLNQVKYATCTHFNVYSYTVVTMQLWVEVHITTQGLYVATALVSMLAQSCKCSDEEKPSKLLNSV